MRAPGPGKCHPWGCFPSTLPRDAVDEVGALGSTQVLCGRDGQGEGVHSALGSKLWGVGVFWGARGGQDTPGVNKVLWEFSAIYPGKDEPRKEEEKD